MYEDYDYADYENADDLECASYEEPWDEIDEDLDYEENWNYFQDHDDQSDFF